MFVVWPNLYEFLATKNDTNLIYGKASIFTRPIRDWYSRWYLSSADYPNEFYPDFVTGQIYMIGCSLLPKLLKVARLVKPIYLEDVWITGILRERIPEAKIVNVKNLIALSLLESTICFPQSFYSIHRVTTNQMRYFFENYSKKTSYICSFLYVAYWDPSEISPFIYFTSLVYQCHTRFSPITLDHCGNSPFESFTISFALILKQ